MVDQDTKPTSTFSADVRKLYAFFKSKALEKNDKIRGVWIADDVGDAPPASTKIDEATLSADRDTLDGVFSLCIRHASIIFEVVPLVRNKD